MVRRPLTARPGSSDKDDEQRLTQTHLEQINSNAEFRDVVKFFESIRYLHLIPHSCVIQRPSRGQEERMTLSGETFLSMWLKLRRRLDGAV